MRRRDLSPPIERFRPNLFVKVRLGGDQGGAWRSRDDGLPEALAESRLEGVQHDLRGQVPTAQARRNREDGEADLLEAVDLEGLPARVVAETGAVEVLA